MGKRELVALPSMSSWCLVIVEWLLLAVPWVCLQFVIVVFPDHTHLLFLKLRSILTISQMTKGLSLLLFDLNLAKEKRRHINASREIESAVSAQCQ